MASLKEFLSEEGDYPLTEAQREFGYTYDAWIEAFGIFKKYSRDGQALGDISAEHDEIYVGPTGEELEAMEDSDKERLLQLSWSFSSEIERFYRRV